MSWLEQLVQTYDENERFAGKFGIDGMKSVLPPVGHILGNAQIEIALNGEGELTSVEVLPKGLSHINHVRQLFSCTKKPPP